MMPPITPGPKEMEAGQTVSQEMAGQMVEMSKGRDGEARISCEAERLDMEILGESGEMELHRMTEDYIEAQIKKPTGSASSLPPKRKLLGQWLSTAICGNNITSSCLYVIALSTVQAGKYAPLTLAFIAAMLYLFRGIYVEVVSALPVNGGTYNLLLNTSTKQFASIAACLTMLSYVTTAVISSTSCMS
eukprot:263893_1